MKSGTVLAFMGVLLLASGCSNNSRQSAPKGSPLVAQAAPPLPALVPSNGTPQVWSLEQSDDRTDSKLREASLDGKFDLLIDLSLIPCAQGNCGSRYGTEVFLATHGRYDALMNKTFTPEQQQLMLLRIEFNDGSVKKVEWVEDTDAANGLLSTLSVYPSMARAPIGLLQRESYSPFGDGSGFLQDLLSHNEALIEIKPGDATQFDLTGLPQEVAAAEASEQTVAQAVDEKAAQQDAADRQAEKEAEQDKPIIDSLNLEDVETRCGEPQHGNAASLAPYWMYNYGLGFAVGGYGVDRKAFDSGMVGQIELRNIQFVTIWFGEGGQPIRSVDVSTYGSNHDKTIDRYTGLPKLMPCLLQGGIAK